RHTRFSRDWSSDVCSSDLIEGGRGTDQPTDDAGNRKAHPGGEVTGGPGKGPSSPRTAFPQEGFAQPSGKESSRRARMTKRIAREQWETRLRILGGTAVAGDALISIHHGSAGLPPLPGSRGAFQRSNRLHRQAERWLSGTR